MLMRFSDRTEAGHLLARSSTHTLISGAGITARRRIRCLRGGPKRYTFYHLLIWNTNIHLLQSGNGCPLGRAKVIYETGYMEASMGQ